MGSRDHSHLYEIVDAMVRGNDSRVRQLIAQAEEIDPVYETAKRQTIKALMELKALTELKLRMQRKVPREMSVEQAREIFEIGLRKR